MNGKNIPLRIGLIGAEGRMGRAISALASLDVCFIPFTRSSPAKTTTQVDVFLDVSSSTACSQNLQVALLSRIPIVVGTTGHMNFDILKEAAYTIPILYSANFSLGIALMLQAAKGFAQTFSRQTTIKIVETHHAHKKDAPSGTALLLAKKIRECHPYQVEIQSIRCEEIIGKHELCFQNGDETLTLTHEIKDRSALAKGALLAARFLALQLPGFYTMDEVLKGTM